jgi:hypothetical protein
VSGGDLVSPPHQCAAQGTNFGWVVLVLEIVAESVNEPDGEVVVVVLVDRTDRLLSVIWP